jgi:1-deoxy-D-xylulose-5-phosphate synthase
MMLETISSNADVHNLTRPDIDVLAAEIRDALVRVCAINGGHLAPNLGVVELTLALHRVLDLPRDKVVWDVSHQSYVHKLLTGRAKRFDTLRQGGGISGFSMRSESPYDSFGAGHASTAISAGLGMVTARDLHGGDETIVAVIGDGALTGGLAYEAINNAGTLKTNFIVILNDNEMSIAPNVGSIASHLGVLRSKPMFTRGREITKDLLGHVPFGGKLRKGLATAEVAAMRFVNPDQKAAVIFEEMGFRYLGPIDGHDYDVLVDVLSNARRIPGPVLLHVRTVKGKGFAPAEVDSRTFHGVGPNVYSPDEGKLEKKAGRIAFAQAFADALVEVAKEDERIIGITAAMPDGTGLAKFGKQFPNRYFDVGIAEAHAVCFAAGAATSGLKPVCAIYSTFLQRAYDQVIHDVVIQELPVVFAIDRAGFVGDDGPTHMGLYDIAYLRALPGLTLMAPRNEHEVAPMLKLALALNAPVAIRYPRGSTSGKYDEPLAPLVLGRAEIMRHGSGVAILSLGNTADAALEAYDLVVAAGGQAPTVVNMRFVKPLDEALLIELSETHERFITLEEHSLAGGFGSAVVECVADRGLDVNVERIGVPNVLVQHNKPERQRAMFGLSSENIAARVEAFSGALTSSP